MNFKTSVLRGFLFSRKQPAPVICIAALLALNLFAPRTTLADGLFVFKWNKTIDINEPTQKAIIVHDAGREDLLLQVKYEGPLEEFGWIIPVPTVPQVNKGSMQPFYELSQLTQRSFGVTHAADQSTGLAVHEEAVKVIEVKTVGAYEVAVLSAKDAGSLSQWLGAHGYSIPDGKADIIDEYIRKGWYFVAAKIRLNQGAVSFTMAPNSPAKNASTAAARSAVQNRLARGELHPLLISFDTPVCVFPLKISSIGGKASEVSLYVLSAEMLLNRHIFDKGREKIDRWDANWKAAESESAKKRQEENLYEQFYIPPGELLQCIKVKPDQLAQSAKALPRLKGLSWYLTKQVWTFAPEEMHDLEFTSAIPALSRVLSRPGGAAAARILAGFNSGGVEALANACKSTNSVERFHAALGLENVYGQDITEPLLTLLKDESPRTRLHAAEAANANWDPRLTQPVFELFRDPNEEIRMSATMCLGIHETKDRSSIYVQRLQDPDLNIRQCSFGVLSRKDPGAISRPMLKALLQDTNQNLQINVLNFLMQTNSNAVAREDLLPLLSVPQIVVVNITLSLLRDYSNGLPDQPENFLSSADAARLTTSPLAMARLAGLKILKNNSDAKAVEVALPLLADANSAVQDHAYEFLRTATGQEIPQTDIAGWQRWWAANQATFQPRKK